MAPVGVSGPKPSLTPSLIADFAGFLVSRVSDLFLVFEYWEIRVGNKKVDYSG